MIAVTRTSRNTSVHGVDGSRPRSDRTTITWLGTAVVLLHVIGWGGLLLVVVPNHYAVGNDALGVGLALTAYTLGMRHAFDADHIAAIDNTTRKLRLDGGRSLTAGFWFSLGHSSVVFVMVLLMSLGVRALTGGVANDQSTLQRVTSIWGTTVSGGFLLLIGVINLVSLTSIVRFLGRLRRGQADELELDEILDKRGLINRLLGRLTKTIRSGWQMYPIGLLFGLGFDTVTEIGLLAVAGGAAASNVPWWAIMTLPIVFAAGMSLLDTVDGIFMSRAYGWALNNPVRKIYYNLVVTAMSVGVALAVGGIEILGLLVDKLHITNGVLVAIGSVNLNQAGFWIVGLFVVTWAGAIAIWRLAGIEQRFALTPSPIHTHGATVHVHAQGPQVSMVEGCESNSVSLPPLVVTQASTEGGPAAA